eukprot:TRINITY_DN22774_c0_g1_i1.p1 TRINITY_DN22774_c0_g1~~TRINITY_DN22774_c0_g1_i1.p1  ORF type:complete len:267 (-),score=44.38 TRINITY_DN22774_c0_g1_i1:80-880(-)
MFELRVFIPHVFYGNCVKANKRVESECEVKVKIPQKYSECSDVIIQGRSPQGILAAKSVILKNTKEFEKRMPISHFVSVPLGMFREKVAELEDAIKEELPEELKDFVQPPEKFHFTLVPLKLFWPAELAKARTVLQNAHSEIYDIVGTRCLIIEMGGLVSLEGDPKKARVLYSKPTDPSGALQKIADLLQQKFIDAGFVVQKHQDSVLLHATVVKLDKKHFNAEKVIEKFGGVSLGSERLTCLQLSQRADRPHGEFYKAEANLPLP